jgi:transposase
MPPPLPGWPEIRRRVPAEQSPDAENRPRRRKSLPRHLKRERIEHDLAEGEKHWEECGEDLRRIGEEISERYEYIPAQMKVIEDVCQKYACACTVKTATKPSQPIEKSTAGASLLTQVIVAKYADHLPLHRQAKMFRRFGVKLSDQTMCEWMARCAALLEPLHERLKQFVLESKVVGTDDTPVKVLDRKLPQTRKGRIWPYVGDRDHVAAVYDYTPTRERAGPEGAWDGRGRLLGTRAPALSSGTGRRSIAHANGVADDRELYRVERLARDRGLRGEELRLLREQGARPVLDRLHAYLLEIRNELLPKSEAGQAVEYALKNWATLTRYSANPDLSIDNNATERSLRCFAVGRNNWTFFGSDRDGRTAAVLRSFITSCELAKVDPFAWFGDVLARIADHPIQKLHELLPHCWIPA